MDVTEKGRAKRRDDMETELCRLAYDRFTLEREKESLVKRIAVLDLSMTGLEAAIRENEKTRTDLATDKAISEAQQCPAMTLDDLSRALLAGQDDEQIAALQAAQLKSKEDPSNA